MEFGSLNKWLEVPNQNSRKQTGIYAVWAGGLNELLLNNIVEAVIVLIIIHRETNRTE